MENKYTLKIKTKNGGDIEITGPSLHDISEVAWIREYLGIESSSPVSTSQSSETNARVDKIEQTVEGMRNAVNQLIALEQQREARQKSQPQTQATAAQQMPATQKTASNDEPDYMSLNPDQMSSDIWEQMSAKEQHEWKQQYGI